MTQPAPEPLVSDIAYGVIDLRLGRKATVVGYQVGLFAVRRAFDGTRLYDGAGGVLMARAFVVDHWPSGGTMGDAASFEDGLVIADELSIALGHVTTCDVMELVRELQRHADLLAWIDAIEVSGKVVGLRAWRAQQATAAGAAA